MPNYDPKEVKKLRDRHRRVLREAAAPPQVVTGGCSGLVSGKRKEDCYLKPPKDLPERTKQVGLSGEVVPDDQ